MRTRRHYHLKHWYYPLGIIVGTFELDSNFWFDRNVIGRMLAVAMGASDLHFENGEDFYAQYVESCRQVGFQDELCRLYGRSVRTWDEYRDKWRNVVWKEWKDDICARITQPTDDLNSM